MILKGMTWSHERGIKPLLAASEAFTKIHPEVEIQWDARSLSDFELFPLEQLADAYDFIMIDHPHIGTAYAESILLPLDTYLSKEFIEDQEENSVGLSHKSYFWQGHQWAIAADSAAQVSAYREDILNELDILVPIDWEEVFALAKSIEGKYKMAIPFVPVHAYSSFFSLASQFGQKVFWSDGSALDLETGVEVLKHLEKILSLSHADSFDMNPIDMLDRMATGEEIVYCPQVYGYSTYSMEGYKGKVIKFNDIPSDTGKPEGSMIGGVGLSITRSCKNPEMAIEFIKMTTSEDYQKTEFAENFGQPGHRLAWQDDAVNAKTKDFFLDTLATLDYGSMRPRFNGYIGFQAEAGTRIRSFIQEARTDYTEFINELNDLFADFYSKREA